MKSKKASPGSKTWAARALVATLAVAVGACGDIYVGSNPSTPSSPSNSGGTAGGGGGSGSGGGGSGNGNGNGSGNGTNTNTTTVNVGQIDNSMSNGPARATVNVDNTQANQQTSTQQTTTQQSAPVAQQVAIDGTQVDQDESVQGQVAAFDGQHDSLQLDVIGVVVQFGKDTRFVGADGKDVTLAAFVTLVQSELQAGRKPGVHCSRKAKKPAQAPHDRTFVATVIQLDVSAVQPAIDCNIDRDHVVQQNGQVFIIVLDVTIELVNGQTQIVLPAGGSSTAQCLQAAQQAVVAVDTGGGTLQLADGTKVVVDAHTQFGTAAAGSITLASLADASTALAAGRTVEATVTGCPQQGQTTVLATVLVLEDRGPGQATTGTVTPGGGGPCLKITGQLASVDVQGGTCRLADSTVVVLDAQTHISTTQEPPDADDAHEGALLGNLSDARDALAAGKTVDAEVAGCVRGQAPLTLLATDLELEVMQP